jgi:hypothetical protein
MAWTNLGTVAPGDVLRASSGTAAYNNVIGNLYMGQPTFTNEAARDAAITAPTEGMTAYLTAPTVPAATGTTTAVPTGVTTIYNGSVWVCTTPVGAISNTSGTTNSASFVTTLTGDATPISATLVTGTTALISIYVNGSNNGAGGLLNFQGAYSVSGATTVAASANDSAKHSISGGGAGTGASYTRIITGLTAGTNTFTLNYTAVSASSVSTYVQRYLTVQGIA